MKRNIVVVLAVLLIAMLLFAGCTSVTIEKPDGTKVNVTTIGSSQVSDMNYDRGKDGIALKIGSTSNTPAGMSEVIESTGSAIAAATTAGVSSAVKTAIKPEKPD